MRVAFKIFGTLLGTGSGTSASGSVQRLGCLLRLHHPRFAVCRTLYGQDMLNMDKFEGERIFLKDEMGIDRKAALVKTLQSVSSPSEIMLHMHTISTLFHCGELEDFPLITKVAEYMSTLGEHHEMSDWYGSTMMRLCHHLTLPEEAYSLYKNPALFLHFRRVSSILVLMDLLYKCKQYYNVVDVYNTIGQRLQLEPNLVTITLAALYKLNTPICLKIAEDLLDSLPGSPPSITHRSALFLTKLHMNQNEPEIAIQMLEKYITTPTLSLMGANLKIQCHSRTGDLKSVNRLLQQLLARAERDKMRPFNYRVYSDTMDEVRKSVKLHGDDLIDLPELEERMVENGMLSRQLTSTLIQRTIPGTDKSYKIDTGRR